MVSTPTHDPAAWGLVAADYASSLAPHFEPFAEEAMRLVPPQATAIDVGTGPGTLALLAAKRGTRVTAVDFSPHMVERLRARAAAAGLTIESRVADAVSLPYADGTFGGGYSMFAFMFVPQPAYAFRELRRVLTPGARAVVSTFLPLVDVPAMAIIADALREQFPGVPVAVDKVILGTHDEVMDAMSGAGFRDVEVHRFDHSIQVTGPHEWWQLMQRTLVPLAMLRQSMGVDWWKISAAVRARLEAALGRGEQGITIPAWMGVGSV